METGRSSLEVIGLIIGGGVWVFYVGDHIALAWNMIKKKHYRSARQSLFEDLMQHPALAWVPVALAIGYTIWLFSLDICPPAIP